MKCALYDTIFEFTIRSWKVFRLFDLQMGKFTDYTQNYTELDQKIQDYIE